MACQKIKRFLISPKTIISLIIITLIACLTGFFIPQITDKSPSYFEIWKEKNIYTFRIVDRLQLNRVYTSFWFLTLVVLITASLGYSIYLQVKKNRKQSKAQSAKGIAQRPVPSGAEGAKNTEESVFTTEDRNRIREILKKRQYREHKTLSSGQKLIFTKNSIGRWGSVIFHSGLLLVIISAFIALSFQQRGFVQLIEGETFDGRDSGFLVKNMGMFKKDFNTGFKTRLSGFSQTYWENKQVRFIESSLVVSGDEQLTKRMLSVNNPLVVKGTKVYQSLNYGYALSFMLEKPTEEKVLTHFTIDRAAEIKKPAFGKSDFPTTDYIFEMKFLPDVSNKSFYLTKPILYLTVFEEDRPVFNGLIIPGNAVKIKEDILYFVDVRYWSGLIFTKNPGIFIAYIGFATGIIGMGIMFLLPYKEIHLAFDTDLGLYDITGITKRYHALFKEEMDEIKKELPERLES